MTARATSELSVSPSVESVLAPLDRVRSALLVRVAPWCATWLVPRARRVPLVGAILVALALAITCAAPIWVLALAPIVWGVPHVLADVRYLVVRPARHRRPLVAALVVGGILLAGLGLGVRGGLVAAAGAALVSRASWPRRAVVVGLATVLFAAATRFTWIADMIFVHAHNFVAIALWWAWRANRRPLHLLPIAIFALGAALMLSGALDGAATSAATIGSLDASYFRFSLAPHVPDALATRLVMLFAFAQGVHYVVWLRLVPEDARPSETPRSFAQSYRALRADVGAPLLAIAALGAVALVLWAVVNLRQAREGYLDFAFFHGHLELAAAALLFCEGRAKS